MKKKEVDKDNQVVELSAEDEPELFEIVVTAFAESPQVPVLIRRPHHTRAVLRQLIEMYRGTGTIKTFGIKEDNSLVCVGLCIDSDAKPTALQEVRFGAALLKTIGFTGLYQFWLYSKKKPPYEKHCLELILYGTKKEYQQKGFGRMMLNYLYQYAEKNGYGGVTGVTNTSRPAYHFYMRDGWIVDAEFIVEGYRVCWVRKQVSLLKEKING